MSLDRQKQPEIYPIHSAKVPEVNSFPLQNGLQLYYLNSGAQDVLKIEFLFKAGFRDEKIKGLASVTASMLFEGTGNFTSKEIHENLDHLGVFFETNTGMDFTSVVFFSLRKHLQKLLPLVNEIILNANFPENELKLLLKKRIKSLRVNQKKNEYLARKLFLATLLGKEHPYTQDLNESDYNAISQDQLFSFYRDKLNPGNCIVLVSGKTQSEDLNNIAEHFGNNPLKNTTGIFTGTIPFSSSSQKQNNLIRPKTVQASIRIGKILFTRNHTDYPGFKVLNEILGGYFGSRLMSNIREEKGYTYGIGSALIPSRDFGIFMIATDSKGEMTEKVLEEIYKEINILRKEPVSNDELNRVKNYMLGGFLASLSSPFSQMDKFSTIYESGLDYSFYRRYIEILRNITPEEIQQLAVKYLEPEKLMEAVVGPGDVL